jgi:hypothetical protein
VNGAASTKPWLSESFVNSGGSLGFTLGTTANTSWGSGTADAPPSFDVTITTRATGPIVGLASKCVDVRNGAATNGTPVQLYTCNSGSAAQQWSVRSDGSLSALGRCLDVPASGQSNNTLVQLFDCNNRNSQVWLPQSNGALLNPNSGKCLDVPNSTSADSTQLQIYTCNGTGAQTWRLPG